MTPSTIDTTNFGINTSEFESAINDMNQMTLNFGKIFTSTIKAAVISGDSLEESLRSIALRISGLALNKSLTPLESVVGSFVGSLTNSILGGQSSAGAPIGIGLQSNVAPANISFNVNATDASSFSRSEGQISALLARAVSRGQRGL